MKTSISSIPQTNHRILHIDMNAFFASVEQQANPAIRNQPVAVVGGPDYKHSAILAASYPAKRLGIGLHTRLAEAKQICSELIVVPLDFTKYYAVNREIVNIFRRCAPIVEVYSIDEAFLDVTEITADLEEAAALAKSISQQIQREVGECLTTSIGVSHNKLLAKIGSNYRKPDAITTIHWDRRYHFLDQIPVGDIWGIGRHSTPKLLKKGITSTQQLRQLELPMLKRMVGSYAERLYMIAHGEYYDPVKPNHNTKPRKSMQHAHTMSSATTDTKALTSLIRKLSEKLARRLRRHQQQAAIIGVGLRPAKQIHYGWGYTPQLYGELAVGSPLNGGAEIYATARQVFDEIYTGSEPIRLVVVSVSQLTSTDIVTLDSKLPCDLTDRVCDDINDKFGEFTIRSGDILYQYAKESELSIARENMTFHPH